LSLEPQRTGGLDEEENQMQAAIEVVREFLTQGTAVGVRLGDPKSTGGLTLIPVFHEGPASDYVLFSEAIACGNVRISEVDDYGDVPVLTVENRADHPLLLVQGEIFAGMKQSRVINATVMVAPGSTVEIPVSCVEAGRWHEETSEAHRGEFNLSPRVRAQMAPEVAYNLRTSGSYEADQSAVWDGVAACLDESGVASPTNSYSDLGRQRRVEIEKFLSGVEPLPGQKGAVAFVGKQPVCMDVFDRSSTLAMLWSGLVGSYFADAVAATPGGEHLAVSRTSEFLGCVQTAQATQHAGVGLGHNVVMTQAAVSGNALVMGDAVVHLAAFMEDITKWVGPRFTSPSRRGI